MLIEKERRPSGAFTSAETSGKWWHHQLAGSDVEDIDGAGVAVEWGVRELEADNPVPNMSPSGRFTERPCANDR